MRLSVVKYELWNALSMCPDEQKTDAIMELEKSLNDSMKSGYRVTVDITIEQ